VTGDVDTEVQPQEVQSAQSAGSAGSAESAESVQSARTTHVLDNATWTALTGPHARFAERHGRAIRYRPDVAPFAALDDPTDERAWADLAELVGPGGIFAMPGVSSPPAGWEMERMLAVLQLVDVSLRAEPDPEAVVLGPADVPEILDLVARTEPGPFLPRTIELGTYLGIRRGGALIAMAGERQHPPGWVEVSAVCTDPAYRGQGLATRMVRAVAAGIRERGEVPFLHAAAANTNAVRLYESIGFEQRCRFDMPLLKRSS
jgi:ribosomal protein S18 acetylase RimI-like enzyme